MPSTTMLSIDVGAGQTAGDRRSRAAVSCAARAARAGRRPRRGSPGSQSAHCVGTSRRMPVGLGLRDQALVLGVVDGLGLVDQHDRDVVAHRVAALQPRVVRARPRRRSTAAGPCPRGRPGSRAASGRVPRACLLPASRSSCLGADERQHLGGVRLARAPCRRASRLRRSSGSVLLGRRLNHQSPRSTVSPSRRSWSASRYARGDPLDDRGGSSTRVLISPDCA